MNTKRRVMKIVAIAVLMSVAAVACGGGADDTASNSGSTVPNFDGGGDEAVVGTIPTTPPIATTAPLTSPDAAQPDSAVETVEASETLDIGTDEDPWEVTVLHVNDDVQIVPTFDAPNGNETKLFDINNIDGIELEYPLLATTAFDNRLALLVTEFDASGNWAKVEVPVRPNGTTAWVQTAFFRQDTHSYHITIDVSENKVNVYNGEELLVEQIAVSGREGRETPVVRSYIDEMIRGETLSPAYGDWVLSIAAFSTALGTFGGGMPKLALHGTNQPELMGQYASSGCVRIPNEIVSFIADNVPVGTIVDIIA